jgi:tRNA-2-methylthio-N6-dimethylallyladenosine synthase
LEDDVPDEVKKRRNNELLSIQNQISEEDNQVFLGQNVEVLVEGPSKWAKQNSDQDSQVLQLTGRTNCDRIVVFDGNRRLAGQILPVGIYEVTPFTLLGTVVTEHRVPALTNLGV